MTKKLIRLREQIIYLLWKTTKLSMRDLAQIFDMSLGNIHRAISKWQDQNQAEFEEDLKSFMNKKNKTSAGGSR